MSYSPHANLVDGPAVDLMALLGRCLGNFKIVERVLTTFRDSGWTDLNQFQAAIEQADYQAVVEISHRFKGSASNVSAMGLTKILIEAERMGLDKDHFELKRILEDLQSEWEAFMRFAQAFVPVTDATKHDSPRQIRETLETRHARAGC